MKLAKVEHYRCSEPSGYTFVWTPDDWNNKQFRDAVKTAQTAYLATLSKICDEPPNDYRQYSGPRFEDHPDRVVSEIQAEWEEKRLLWQQWNTAKQARRRQFSHFLADQGMIMIWDHEPDLSETIDWGHRHGLSIDYAETPEDTSLTPDQSIGVTNDDNYFE